MLHSEPNQLEEWLKARGERAYRARQIRDWAIVRRATDFASMTDLPLQLRTALDSDWSILQSEIVRTQGDTDSTRKLLLRFADGRTVECVLLFEDQRRTICLSTQVGCGMGCVFCASGVGGVERNLTREEMIEELLLARNLLPQDERVTNIVVMGMGEPLANLDNLLQTLEFAIDHKGLAVGARHINISTVGLPKKMLQLAHSGRPYHLAVSLHAPNDELRRRIVPTAEKTPLSEILAAADQFRQITGRRVTFEYVLLDGINDAPEHARQLAAFLGQRDAMVNLIPYNPVEGMPWKTPPPETTARFAEILYNAGLLVKTRKRKGAKIDAACGQLRRAEAQQQLVQLPVG